MVPPRSSCCSPPEIRDRLCGRCVMARCNTESHFATLVRACIGVGVPDCFLEDADPLLRCVCPEPLDVANKWAVDHLTTAKTPSMP
jgi:hypothetical protein